VIERLGPGQGPAAAEVQCDFLGIGKSVWPF
jgi:hypothetical protein